MPYLVRFLLGHAAIGIAVAVVTVAGIVVFDIAGLGTLAAGSEDGLLALFLLTFFLGLTFGSAQMGFAVMRHKPSAGEGGLRAPLLSFGRPAAVPVRAAVHARR